MTKTQKFKYRVEEDGTCTITSGTKERFITIPGVIDGHIVSTIGEKAFKNDRELRSLELPDSIMMLEAECFAGCINLREIEGGNNVRVIEQNAFAGCVNLYRILLPEKVGHIGDCSFENCSKATIGTIPSSLRYLGKGVFRGCESITKFDIEDNSNYKIVSRGIVSCENDELLAYPLGHDEEIVIGNGIRKVGGEVFGRCDKTRVITIGATVEDFDPSSVDECSSLSRFRTTPDCTAYSVSNGILYSGDYSILLRCPIRMRVINAHIHPDCTSLGKLAFRRCEMNAVFMGKNIRSISSDAFKDSEDIKRIAFQEGFCAFFPLDMHTSEGKIINGADLAGYVFIRNEKGHFVKTFRSDKLFELEKHQYESMKQDKMTALVPEKPIGISMDDVIGNEEAKKEIFQRLVLPFRRPELYSKYGLTGGGGVMLIGPPGTGKTMLAKAVAAELDAKFYSVSPSDLMNKYVGETEGRIRKLFETARQNSPSVIFIDDVDGIARGRDSGNAFDRSMLAELLTQMQGLGRDNSNVLVLAATNRPGDIDSALMRSGRFDCKVLVGLPESDARKQIFRKNLEKCPHSRIDYNILAANTDMYNCADIVEICNRAKRSRIEKVYHENRSEKLSMGDLLKAIEDTPTSVRREDIEEVLKYFCPGKYGKSNDGEGEKYIPSNEKIFGYI